MSQPAEGAGQENERAPQSRPPGGGREAPRGLVAAAPAGQTCPTSELPLQVRCQIHLLGGEAGRALAAAQGRALADLLAFLAEVEVGQGQEDPS